MSQRELARHYGQWVFVDGHYWVLYDHRGDEIYHCDMRESSASQWLARLSQKTGADWTDERLAQLVRGMAQRGDL